MQRCLENEWKRRIREGTHTEWLIATMVIDCIIDRLGEERLSEVAHVNDFGR
jgi:hypothetical protein